MKLLGRDIPTGALMARIEERLRIRGLPTSEAAEVPEDGVEPRVDPLTFNMHALEDNADPTRALPLHTHRAGMGQAVLLAKWAFRKTCQVLINETLGRQRVFNGLVRDSYAQLSAEVLRLRREVDTLRAQAAKAPPPEAPRPPKPPPALSHGRPASRPHDDEDEGPPPRERPLPAIQYGRPPKPRREAPVRPPKPPSSALPSRAAETAPAEQGRPTAPPRSDLNASPKPAAQDERRPPAKPAHPKSARPAKASREQMPPAEGPPSAPRGSRSKRGGPKKA
ncbi:hypothetical protein [Corallococcus sp. EGB]|uniref:hypothetical protein n=1 Tax=Corallococcus sp. EGB TaxID=1521117 RepID=UPI001CBF74EB|nr:hypothetical protein [Corallococcus sp. EGB]